MSMRIGSTLMMMEQLTHLQRRRITKKKSQIIRLHHKGNISLCTSQAENGGRCHVGWKGRDLANSEDDNHPEDLSKQTCRHI